MAAEWDGDADAQFEPGERLLFYAAPRFSRYTRRDGYWLSVAAAPAQRMAARSAAPPVGAVPAWRSVTAEQNLIYYALNCRCAPGRDGERWMWVYLAGPGAQSYALDTPARAADQPASLTAWFVGYTALEHQVDIAVNGVALGTARWAGQQAYTFTVPIPAGALLAGANSVSLTVPPLDGLWLDALRVDYAVDAGAPVDGPEFAAGPPGASAAALPAAPQRVFLPFLAQRFVSSAAHSVRLAAAGPYRAYDLTDPAQPTRLTGIQVAGQTVTWAASAGGAGRYLLASESDIRLPAALRPPAPLPAVAGADYLVIAPADLAPALGPLLALRQAQGLTTVVADAQAVYDAFDSGRATPEALRRFLAAVYAGWSPRPLSVLLVGDATFDPKRYRADSQVTRLPTELAEVDPWMGETAADNGLAAVDGADRLPDFLLGRLPVTTITETQAVVAKLVNYETAPPAGDWPARALFVADEADPAGDFAAQSEAWIGLAPDSAIVQRVFHGSTTFSVADTREAIRSAWDLGAGLVAFNGHASQRQWAAERLFHLDDVGALANAGRLPVVLQMTCLTGSFHDAALPALDEALLRQPGGGAVGVWGSTGLGVANGHDLLAQAFLQRAFQGGAVTAGAAALAGKLALAQNGQHPDLIETFTWLGDPATRLPLSAGP